MRSQCILTYFVAASFALTTINAVSFADAPPTTTSATAATWYEPVSPYKVETLDLDLSDVVRGKQLPLRIRIPLQATGPAPIVVFSHGAGGSRDAFPDLSSSWASRGYIVIHCTHDDSIQLRRQKGEKLDQLIANPKSLKSDVKPMERLADVKLIIDKLSDIEKAITARRGAEKLHIDTARIAIAGHSAGALTTQMAIGVKVRGTRVGAGLLTPTDVGDSRIACAIVISGQGLTNRMMTKDSWSEVAKPMLVISGSKDVSGISDETPESRRHPYENAKPGDKYLLFMEGATHSSYQGKVKLRAIQGDNPDDATLKMITRCTESATTAFLDCYLKKDRTAREFLASDNLPKLTDGKAEFAHK